MATRSREWFAGRIRKLGALLKRLPQGRQHALWRTINAPDNTQDASDDCVRNGRVDGQPGRERQIC
jgi:alkylated DNA nucleotide flippase Atl1